MSPSAVRSMRQRQRPAGRWSGWAARAGRPRGRAGDLATAGAHRQPRLQRRDDSAAGKAGTDEFGPQWSPPV